MSLYAIGDLHLSFGTDKPMDIFGREWKNHPEKIEKYWKKRIRPEDTIVLLGDHSWGKNLKQAADDLQFIIDLPGEKILLRGNHDMFWDVKHTTKLNTIYKDQLSFLQNNYFTYGEYGLVGTKGYCYEGKDTPEQAEKLFLREEERLICSIESAIEGACKKLIMFLHYPPTSIGEQESRFTRLAEYYHVEQVIYAHCHGVDRFGDSFHGRVNGIDYHLVSSDYLHFRPKLLLM